MGHGGARLGAGRPPGLTEALPRGAVKALRGLRHRVPVGTPEPLSDLADSALEAIAEAIGFFIIVYSLAGTRG